MEQPGQPTAAVAATSAAAAAGAAPKDKDFRGKSGKKICCACPETKNERDKCVVELGQDKCADIIEKHKRCLRDDGFDV